MSLHSFTIDEATISLFPTDADGQPVTDSPVWLGVAAESIQIRESLEEIVDRPSGMPYPEVHHGAEEHNISIDRLWELKLPVVDQPNALSVTLAAMNIAEPIPAQNGLDYRLRPDMKYVAVIVWEDEDDAQRFHFRIYYGVTDRSHELSGSTGNGKRSGLSFRAEYYLS